MNANLPTGRAGQLLAVGLVLIALGVIWLAIASPLIGWYDSRAATLAERTRFERHLTALAARLPALERSAHHLAAASPARQALLGGATNAIAGATLQQIVQSLATRTGATLSSAEALPARKDGQYRRIRLRVAVSGAWPVLVHLLAAITTGAPVMLIDDLRLSSAGLRLHPGAVPFDANFTVIAFRAAAVHPTGAEAGRRDAGTQAVAGQ